ncbi:MAG TPA: helix-turn-helix domain-containing protein [Candidatus Nanoarchaeia archaeon]|nr:helix-turn-helix domain-containing protein [Candidatus Nanoarchaeia archaeon]
MAKHETFIMVSLEEEKAKKLAEVISNNTSRKILDHLAKKEASESELAKELSLPISTVHYNIQLLLKTNLVQSKEFTWSDKGKEINIYTLSKKYIIIAPSGTKVKESFKNILPATLITFAIAGLIQLYYKTQFKEFDSISAPAAESALTKTAMVTNTIPNYALWFLLGSLSIIIIYLIHSILKNK